MFALGGALVPTEETANRGTTTTTTTTTLTIRTYGGSSLSSIRHFDDLVADDPGLTLSLPAGAPRTTPATLTAPVLRAVTAPAVR